MKRCKSKGKKRLVQVITTGGEQQGEGEVGGTDVGAWGAETARREQVEWKEIGII